MSRKHGTLAVSRQIRAVRIALGFDAKMILKIHLLRARESISLPLQVRANLHGCDLLKLHSPYTCGRMSPADSLGASEIPGS